MAWWRSASARHFAIFEEGTATSSAENLLTRAGYKPDESSSRFGDVTAYGPITDPHRDAGGLAGNQPLAVFRAFLKLLRSATANS
jgi:hypothetical protein